MYIGKIIHFSKGNKNGFISYRDENGQLNEIYFYHQDYRHFIEDSYSRKRGWKYGDTIEFEIESYNGHPEAVFKRFLGNTLIDQLKRSIGENNIIEGYFYLHKNTLHCTLREKNTGVEFMITNVHRKYGWILPENGTLVRGTITDLEKLTCTTNDCMRDEVFEQEIAKIETKRFVRATVSELIPENNIMHIKIDGFRYTGYVLMKNVKETYQVGDPINVRLIKKAMLKFVII